MLACYDVFGVILEILGLKGQHGRNLENGIGVIGPNGPAGLSHVVSDKWGPQLDLESSGIIGAQEHVVLITVTTELEEGDVGMTGWCHVMDTKRERLEGKYMI